MKTSTYDSCLLYANIENFGVVGLQTDDSLILTNEAFVVKKEKHLKKKKLLVKNREKLIIIQFIKFNKNIIKRNENENIYLHQKKQCTNFRFVVFKKFIDLMNAKNKVKKIVTLKNQYIAQWTKNTYIVIVSQFKTTFNLSFVVQIINSKNENVKLLNKRLQ